MKACESCGMPMDGKTVCGYDNRYCVYCMDEKTGFLRSGADKKDIWSRLIDLNEAKRDTGFLKTFKKPPIFVRDAFFSVLKLLFRALFSYEARGAENVPIKGPYILAANHSSALDYPVVAMALPRDARDALYAVTTSYFYDNPLIRSFIMIATNSIRIDTKEDYTPALKAAAKALAQGGSVYINPEGTWSETGELMEFKPGVGLLSYELNVPVVPVYISGTFDILPPKAKFPRRRGSVKVKFGPPILPDKSMPAAYGTYKDIADKVREAVIFLRDEKDSI